MSYEKQTWQTGDIITAEKLNHMEDGIKEAPGYIVTNNKTTIFEGELTTTSMGSFSGANVVLSQSIIGDYVIVTVDEIVCQLPKVVLSFGTGYGEFDNNGSPIFINYPCAFGTNGNDCYFFTSKDDTYEVKIETVGNVIEPSEFFGKAVQMVLPNNEFIVHCQFIGMDYTIDKTYEEIYSAITNGKKVIFYKGFIPYQFSGISYNESKGEFLQFNYISSNIDNYGNIYSVSIDILYYCSNGEIGSAYRQIYSTN